MSKNSYDDALSEALEANRELRDDNFVTPDALLVFTVATGELEEMELWELPLRYPLKQPGQRWSYSNLGEVVEAKATLYRQMTELMFLRHMSEFAVYLEEKGLAVPHGKTLENNTTASADHRYDWKWADSVCLKDLLNYFAINGVEVTDLEGTERDLQTIEETEEELLGCL